MSKPRGDHALNEATQRFQYIFDSMIDACFVIDHDWRFSLANAATSRLTSSRERDLIGQVVTDLITGDDADLILHPYRQVMEEGTARQFTTSRLPLPDPIPGHFDMAVCKVPEGIMCIAHDVSDRVRTEEALKNSESHYHTLFEESHEALFITAVDGKFIDFNQTMLDLLGYSRQEFSRLNVEDAYEKPEDRVAFVKLVTSETAARDYPVRLKRKDGTIIDCLATASVWHEHDGNVTGIQGILRDVTVQKQAIDALRESEERFRAIFEGTTLGIVLVDLDGQPLVTNRAFQGMVGRSGDELRALTFGDVLHPDDRQLNLTLFADLLHGERDIYQSELRCLHKDGGLVWVNLTASMVRDRDNMTLFVVFAIEDITKRVEAEEAANRLNTALHALQGTLTALNSTLDLNEVLNLILDGVSQVVPHDAATIMLIEDGYIRIVGHHGYQQRNLEEAVARMRQPVSDIPTFRIMAETRQPLAIPDLADSKEWVTAKHGEWIRSYAGAPICLQEEVLGFINLDSTTPGFFTATDADRLMTFADQAAAAIKNARLYAELQQHALELQASNEDLDSFSEIVAHDLRAPLHVMLGYTTLVLTDYRSEITDEVASHLKQVETYTYNMNAMIESILLLAKMRTSEIIMTPVTMAPIVNAAINRFKDRAREANVTITVDLPLPPVLGYAPGLEEVLANLIENAIKYMNKSNPDPQITIRGFNIEGDLTRYEVTDNGVGIAPEFQMALFNRGFRAGQSKVKGIGLGLSIVKRIILQLNGQVGVESERGKGSTFWFTLPTPPG